MKQWFVARGREALIHSYDRTKSCSWCPCRNFMCSYFDLTKQQRLNARLGARTWVLLGCQHCLGELAEGCASTDPAWGVQGQLSSPWGVQESDRGEQAFSFGWVGLEEWQRGGWRGPGFWKTLDASSLHFCLVLRRQLCGQHQVLQHFHQGLQVLAAGYPQVSGTACVYTVPSCCSGWGAVSAASDGAGLEMSLPG